MGILQRFAVLGVVVSVATACTAQSSSPSKGLADNSSGAMPPGLTCPVMTTVEYDHIRHTTMLGASPENPLICLIKRPVGGPRPLLLNWYAVDRLRKEDVDHGIELITSLLTGPVGFTTDWNRFLTASPFSYVSHFTVAPSQSMTVGYKTYDVRVIKSSHRPYEDNETWIDKDSLTILKYLDYVYPSHSYTVTGLVKAPPS
jgi:hypothetical protein